MTELNKKYDTVLIIGNGFDLNQRLPTSYSEFIRSKNFTSLLDASNYLAEHLANEHDLHNWIDIENELKSYSNKQKSEEVNKSFENEFYLLCKALKNYLDGLDYKSILEDSFSFQLMEKIKNDNFVILNFNYTNTTSNILNYLKIADHEIKSRTLKIHGNYSDEIIFGIEDRASIDRNHVFLRKAFNKNFIGIDFKNILESCKDIYIFGHSLGETDHMYFSDFFQVHSMEYSNGRGKRIHLYHYGQEAYKQLFIQIDEMTLNNLSMFRKINELNFIDTKK